MAKFKGQVNIADQSESDLSKEINIGLVNKFVKTATNMEVETGSIGMGENMDRDHRHVRNDGLKELDNATD
jgi:hypothetical protein